MATASAEQSAPPLFSLASLENLAKFGVKSLLPKLLPEQEGVFHYSPNWGDLLEQAATEGVGLAAHGLFEKDATQPEQEGISLDIQHGKVRISRTNLRWT